MLFQKLKKTDEGYFIQVPHELITQLRLEDGDGVAIEIVPAPSSEAKFKNKFDAIHHIDKLDMEKLASILNEPCKSEGYILADTISLKDIEVLVEKLNLELRYIDGLQILSSYHFRNFCSYEWELGYTPNPYSWDDFYERLTDKVERAEKGFVVFYDKFELFAQAEPQAFNTALSCIAMSISYHPTSMYFLLKGNIK